MYAKLLQHTWYSMKLSADSQKQYWEIKQKYRDVMLFFKVGTFYELYEDDAQIGHDVLGWKMTVSGVGHCRQVLLTLQNRCAYLLMSVSPTFDCQPCARHRDYGGHMHVQFSSTNHILLATVADAWLHTCMKSAVPDNQFRNCCCW